VKSEPEAPASEFRDCSLAGASGSDRARAQCRREPLSADADRDAADVGVEHFLESKEIFIISASFTPPQHKGEQPTAAGLLRNTFAHTRLGEVGVSGAIVPEAGSRLRSAYP
jgi:hypothetical protein